MSKLIALFVNIISASVAIAWFLPPLSTDDEKLNFLLQVKREIPHLFSDAAKYEIDLFSLLDNEQELVELLEKYTKFQDLHKKKSYLTMHVSVEENKTIMVGDIEVKPEAIKGWKQSLFDTIELNKKEFGTFKEACDNRLDPNLLYKVDPLITLNKIGMIENKAKRKTSKTEKQAMKDLLPRNNIVTECKKRVGLVEKFECVLGNYNKIAGLPNLPSEDEIKKFIKGIKAEETMLSLLHLALVSHKQICQSWEEVQNYIESLGGEDLIYMNDRDDVLVPLLKKYLSDNEAHISRALAIVHMKMISRFAVQTISHQRPIKSEIVLKQVRPEIGIFRGCTGGDCSSQYSFPYPNDPHERVFFIEKQNTIKGYLSAIEVLVNGQKVLYVITISGAHLSSMDTELILRGLEKAKQLLGVEHIVLPDAGNINALINFPAVRSIYENHIKHKASVELLYQDQEIRTAIQNYQPNSGYNKGEYDYMNNNKTGHILFIKENPVLVKIVDDEQTSINPLLLKDEIFEFFCDLNKSKRDTMSEKLRAMPTVARIFGDNASDTIKHLFATLNFGKKSNSNESLSIAEYKESIKLDLLNLGMPENYWENNTSILIRGYFLCRDVFNKENLEAAGQLMADDLRINGNESAVFSVITGENIITLSQTQALIKLGDELYGMLFSKQIAARIKAVKLIAKIRVNAPKVQLKILEMLADPDCKEEALNVLPGLLNNYDIFYSENVSLELVKLLHDKDDKVVLFSSEIIERLKAKNGCEVERTFIVKYLIGLLGQSEPKLVKIAANLMAKINPHNEDLILTLSNMLESSEEVSNGLALSIIEDIINCYDLDFVKNKNIFIKLLLSKKIIVEKIILNISDKKIRPDQFNHLIVENVFLSQIIEQFNCGDTKLSNIAAKAINELTLTYKIKLVEKSIDELDGCNGFQSLQVINLIGCDNYPVFNKLINYLLFSDINKHSKDIINLALKYDRMFSALEYDDEFSRKDGVCKLLELFKSPNKENRNKAFLYFYNLPNHSKYPEINDQINQFKNSLELYKTKIGLEPMDEQSFEYIENFLESISKNIQTKDNPNGFMYDLY